MVADINWSTLNLGQAMPALLQILSPSSLAGQQHLSQEKLSLTNSSISVEDRIQSLRILLSGYLKRLVAVGISESDYDKNFFELGNNSLMAAEFAHIINKEMKDMVTITIKDIYTYNTINSLASFIQSNFTENAAPSIGSIITESTSKTRDENDFKIHFESPVSKTTKDLIKSGLNSYNEILLRKTHEQDLIFIFQDKKTNATVAGLVGTISAYEDKKTASINALWVRKDYRKQGIANRLFKAFESHVFNEGCDTIQVDLFNYQHPSFFEKQGFELVKILPNFPAPYDLFLLRKDIAQLKGMPEKIEDILFVSDDGLIKGMLLKEMAMINSHYFEGHPIDFAIYITSGHNNSIVGGAMGYHVMSYGVGTSAWIDSNFRGTNVSKILFDSFTDYLKRQNCKEFIGGTLGSDALSLYLKSGFYVVEKIPEWVGKADKTFIRKKL
jgi:ribosomal protein S18 acetylase RimI-like enzyme